MNKKILKKIFYIVLFLLYCIVCHKYVDIEFIDSVHPFIGFIYKIVMTPAFIIIAIPFFLMGLIMILIGFLKIII